MDACNKQQLNQNLIVIANEKTLSGCGFAKISRGKLIYNGEDDPSELRTIAELKDDGYGKEEIEGMEIMLNKGEFYIELP